MASVQLFAGAAVSEAPGTFAWTSLTNITSDNDVDVVVVRMDDTETTEHLRSTTYGFSIPTGDTIDGIRVTLEILDLEAANTGFDLNVQLAKAGVPGGNDKSLAAFIPSARTVRTYGSPTDLWGVTWTPAQINATGFGLDYRAHAVGDRAEPNIDYHRIEVFHTAPAAAGVPLVTAPYRAT